MRSDIGGPLVTQRRTDWATKFRLAQAESTGQGKSKAIRRMFGIGRLNPDWTLPSRLGDNPLVWKVEVNGMLVDIRQESRERQEAAFQKGLIPYIPADLHR